MWVQGMVFGLVFCEASLKVAGPFTFSCFGVGWIEVISATNQSESLRALGPMGVFHGAAYTPNPCGQSCCCYVIIQLQGDIRVSLGLRTLVCVSYTLDKHKAFSIPCVTISSWVHHGLQVGGPMISSASAVCFGWCLSGTRTPLH